MVLVESAAPAAGVTALREFFVKHFWLFPALFAVLLGAAGWTSYRALERNTQERLRNELQTILDADVTALRIWLEIQQTVAQVEAADPVLRARFAELEAITRTRPEPRDALLAASAREPLTESLQSVSRAHGYLGFGIFDRRGVVLAGFRRQIGRTTWTDQALQKRVLAGETLVTPPMVWELPEEPGGPLVPTQIMLLLTPVRRPGDQVVSGALAFGLRPEADFSEILRVARLGESGETYAFTADGRMVSESRFEDQLREIGLISGGDDSRSSLSVHVRDPGGNMLEGFVPDLPVLARPLTRMAAEAVTGQGGVDVAGYRDYRGVPVVGAWTWLPELGLGLTSELDAAEAYAGLHGLQRRFAVVVGVLALAAVGLLFYSAVLSRLSSRFDEVRQLGRYRIGRKIGEGGMGAVYMARHALLRRPTAVKLLRPDAKSDESIVRFEREVQAAAALSHPNTISIYDYGHTPDGVFYYAMEYLDGVDIGRCVHAGGPFPEARVVHVMKQVCASLAEAHAAGLIHRDLKPANVMLCERGGLSDFVKVLDFGLVRAADRDQTLNVTNVQALTGTPLYLAPEAIETPDQLDARADVYQLGGIAYYLLVGRHVFEGETVVEVLGKHLHTAPVPPSEALERPASPDLERIILRCLAKDPAERYAHGAELLEAFESCSFTGSWGQKEARDWWLLWRAQHPAPSADEDVAGASHPSGYSVDLEDRLGTRSS